MVGHKYRIRFFVFLFPTIDKQIERSQLKEKNLTQSFATYRTQSVARPNVTAGMLEGYAVMSGKSHFTRAELEARTAETMGFYADRLFLQMRGEEARSEKFVLQGLQDGGDWIDIKPIAPIEGENPNEPDFGNCMRCGSPLEESEYAIGDVCDGCRPQYMKDWKANQERLAEEAAEHRRYPEESDDDDPDEDPLAGDVEPIGGYYEPPIHPFEAHRLEVMRQHGDYTG
jgi:hypothetical protein